MFRVMKPATASSLRVPFVDLHTQHLSIQGEIQEAIDAVLADSAFIGGHYVARFEEQFAAFTGACHVVGVSSGTDALILSLMSLGFSCTSQLLHRDFRGGDPRRRYAPILRCRSRHLLAGPGLCCPAGDLTHSDYIACPPVWPNGRHVPGASVCRLA